MGLTSDDRQTDVFFRQCIADGRMTQAEYEGLRVDHYSAGTRPDWTPLPRGYSYWCNKRGIVSRDVEIYLNSEAWTHAEIAEYLGVSIRRVGLAIGRVYRLLPELKQFRGNGRNIPELRHMLSIEVSDIDGNSFADHESVREQY